MKVGSVFAAIFSSVFLFGCASPQNVRAEPTMTNQTDPFWRNATVYFLMTDRFANGDPTNDTAYDRQPDGDKLRSFMGGDIQGIIDKLEEGYFSDLGVDAIWTTPVIEQVHQPFEEYGRSYAFHGYWPRDWTNVDAAYGTEADFARMVELAHDQGIRVIVDVIINHSGPPIGGPDPVWPEDWVRTEPVCDWESFEGNATCLIVPALQDIRTEDEADVELPPHLIEKWRQEGRLDTELAELDAFFERTGHPRAPKYYIMKWVTDWVREYGVDGFRIDTAKHVEPEVWADLKIEADLALAEWRANNTSQGPDDREFFMFGEVFNYGLDGFQKTVAGSRDFDFGDRRVDFYDHGFAGLINMGFATHAAASPQDLFERYDAELHGTHAGVGVLNYISSHDDQAPLDPERKAPFLNAAKLMLAPGGAQIFYGDELSRGLVVPGTVGDATLRSFMNWEALDTAEGQAILTHWQKLGQFRQAHPAIGAGRHRTISEAPFVFSRTLDEAGYEDKVLVALSDDAFDQITVGESFVDGMWLRDTYSGETVEVSGGQIVFASPRDIALLEAASP